MPEEVKTIHEINSGSGTSAWLTRDTVSAHEGYCIDKNSFWDLM